MRRVLFYMPVQYSSLKERFALIEEHMLRGELMYCAGDLNKYDCKLLIPKTKIFPVGSKFLKLYYTLYLLFIQSKYDIIYSPYYQGLEWLMHFRKLGLFRKKIVVWQHSPLESSKKENRLLEGCDALFFFTDKIKSLSINKGIPENKLYVMNWGPDMGFFNSRRIPYSHNNGKFLMSGSDSRDFKSCIESFYNIKSHLDVYPPNSLNLDITKDLPQNIKIRRLPHTHEGYERMARITAESKCVLIITAPVPGRKLPSGLSSICEAVALGKPCIITDNPYFSDEMRNAGFAIFVKVGDVEGIKTAVMRLENDDELCQKMSDAALVYARKHNSETMAKSLSDILHSL